MSEESKIFTRREFSKISALSILGVLASGPLSAADMKKFKLGLVTYQWGKDWDLDTLIKNCTMAGIGGVELRTQHAHKVEPSLTALQRKEVKKKFAGSGVECLGYGSNQEFHNPDQKKLREQIEGTFELIKLCHDIGATGVKVKPNNLPEGVPAEKTIEQIGRSLNEIGKYARDYGQLIRVEVHGPRSQEIPNMKAIFDHVDQPNVKICWNSNPTDLKDPGLETNFRSVSKWMGDTAHVRQLNSTEYPYSELFRLFSEINYKGWFLLEESVEPADIVAALKEQRKFFDQLTAKK